MKRKLILCFLALAALAHQVYSMSPSPPPKGGQQAHHPAGGGGGGKQPPPPQPLKCTQPKYCARKLWAWRPMWEACNCTGDGATEDVQGRERQRRGGRGIRAIFNLLRGKIGYRITAARRPPPPNDTNDQQHTTPDPEDKPKFEYFQVMNKTCGKIADADLTTAAVFAAVPEDDEVELTQKTKVALVVRQKRKDGDTDDDTKRVGAKLFDCRNYPPPGDALSGGTGKTTGTDAVKSVTKHPSISVQQQPAPGQNAQQRNPTSPPPEDGGDSTGVIVAVVVVLLLLVLVGVLGFLFYKRRQAQADGEKGETEDGAGQEYYDHNPAYESSGGPSAGGGGGENRPNEQTGNKLKQAKEAEANMGNNYS